MPAHATPAAPRHRVRLPGHVKRLGATLASAMALVALAAPAALAHGGGPGEPAGGGAIGEVVIGSIASLVLAALMVYLVVGHRRGTVGIVGKAAALAERRTGLPGWSSLPVTVQSASLLIAVFGMYWDISTHLDAGRDAGPFANASHYFILIGLFGIVFAGLLAIFLPKEERPGQAAVKVPKGGWHAPLGGVLIFLCGLIALSGFPLDDIWHRIFGQDVTLWGPTHLILFGGASLSVLGAVILTEEGRRAAPRADTSRPPQPGRGEGRMRSVLVVGFSGALLIGLSTFQGEFDFSVPQFRLIMHPVLLMIAASVALVAARTYLGRGGALLAVAFYLLVRGALTLLVTPLFGHSTLHFPLYLAEAVVVELVALWIKPSRTTLFGAVAGAAVGTFGLAAEWAWSYLWWTVEWPATLLPEAAIAGFVVAVAGGLIGASMGRALTGTAPHPRRAAKLVPIAAGVAIIGVLVYSVPITEGPPARATVQLTEAVPPPERAVQATVSLDPPNAADGAHWLLATSWQGKEDRSVVQKLEPIGPGVYRTTEPVPVHGDWKATIRLHKDAAVQGLAIFFKGDPAIPAPEIPAPPVFTREFITDKMLLQREQKPGVPEGLKIFAYVSVLAIAILLIASLVLGLRRFQQRIAAAPAQGDGRAQSGGSEKDGAARAEGSADRAASDRSGQAKSGERVSG
jgi:hypothetical protein